MTQWQQSMSLIALIGDANEKHFAEPKDAAVLAGVAEKLLDGAKRHIEWIHLPVPKSRTDDAYFSPLRRVAEIAQERQIQLTLGVVQDNDLEGTKKRIEAASKVVPSFFVATECGMGRRNKEKLTSTLEIEAAVAAVK
jgi:hypothetical protein